MAGREVAIDCTCPPGFDLPESLPKNPIPLQIGFVETYKHNWTDLHLRGGLPVGGHKTTLENILVLGQQPACGEFLESSCLKEAADRLSFQDPTRLHRLAFMESFSKEEVDQLVSPDSPMHVLALTLRERPLILRVIQKDSDAFEEVHQSYHDRVYYYIYHRIGHIEESEDLTVETFFRVWQAIDRGVYEQKGPIAGYLVRIAHNLVANNYRDKNRKQVNSLDDGKTGEIPAGDEFDPQAWVERIAANEQLRQELSRLNPLQREVIKMHLIDGVSHTVIASKVGKTEGAVKAQLHRARIILRRNMSNTDSS